MCTVSWFRSLNGLSLYFNRDERRTRKPAAPPVLHSRRGVSYLAPVDGDAGGTWILVNQFGLVVCLLNDYQAPEPAGNSVPPSRGQLVAEFGDARGVEDVLARMGTADLLPYRGFVLLALEPEADATAILHWNASELLVRRADPERRLLVSSGWNPKAVIEERERTFDGTVAFAAEDPHLAHHRFHQSHSPARGPFSPCMHRDDAHTVSASRLWVSEERAQFWYTEGAPCEGGAFTERSLARVGTR